VSNVRILCLVGISLLAGCTATPPAPTSTPAPQPFIELKGAVECRFSAQSVLAATLGHKLVLSFYDVALPENVDQRVFFVPKGPFQALSLTTLHRGLGAAKCNLTLFRRAGADSDVTRSEVGDSVDLIIDRWEPPSQIWGHVDTPTVHTDEFSAPVKEIDPAAGAAD
jgi:hypothetical protein